MQVRDKDGTNLGEAQMRTAQLYLSALTAIHKEQLAPYLNDLSRGIMVQGWQGTATPKDMNSEWLQNAQITDYMKNSSWASSSSTSIP